MYENATDIYYEVGCKDNCEYLEETAGDSDTVTKTTRCCDTDLCNIDPLSDHDQVNTAVSMTSQFPLSDHDQVNTAVSMTSQLLAVIMPPIVGSFLLSA